MRNIYESIFYAGVKVLISHEKESLKLIRKTVMKYEPEIMIELGTAYYGLTLLLHECNRDVPLYTFDKYCGRLHLGKTRRKVTREQIEFAFRRAFNTNVTFILGDIVYRQCPILTELVQKPERKLLYCDNGKKKWEMLNYGSLLNKGDLMGVHDWGIEVKPDDEEIINLLKNFDEHPVNAQFEERKLMTRFFTKR